eukprot:gene7794-986_t
MGPNVAPNITFASPMGPTVLLSWVLSKGLGAVTTSRSEERLTSFLKVGEENSNLKLSDEEVKAIDEAGAQKHFRKYWVDNFKDN